MAHSADELCSAAFNALLDRMAQAYLDSAAGVDLEDAKSLVMSLLSGLKKG